MNDKYYIKPHIYSIIGFISRFAFLLIIPALQFVIFREIKTVHSILTVLGCAIVIIYAFIRRKSEFFLADKDRILINKGVIIKSQKFIKNENISTLNIKRGLISGGIFAAAEVFLDVPSTFRDIKTSFYMSVKKAYEIFCEKAAVIYRSEFKKVFLSAIGVPSKACTKEVVKCTSICCGGDCFIGSHVAELRTTAECAYMAIKYVCSDISLNGFGIVNSASIEIRNIGIVDLPAYIAVILAIIVTNLLLSGSC